jgi:transcription antitermination factor NusG
MEPVMLGSTTDTLSLRSEERDCFSQTRDLSVLWHVLYVKSRQEKALSKDLTELGIGHYLPQRNDLKYYGKRRFIVSAPLFPGYLFLHDTREQLYRSERTGRVVSILPVRDQNRFDLELRNIKLALELKAPLSPHRLLDKGCRVEVRAGPFRGLQGVVEDPANMNRIVLQVEMLGRAVSMEIDGRLLDLLPDESAN